MGDHAPVDITQFLNSVLNGLEAKLHKPESCKRPFLSVRGFKKLLAFFSTNHE